MAEKLMGFPGQNWPTGQGLMLVVWVPWAGLDHWLSVKLIRKLEMKKCFFETVEKPSG